MKQKVQKSIFCFMFVFANVDENLSENTLVYPNPANDVVTVRVGTNTMLNLLDMNGKIILSQQLREGENRIGLYELEKGVYIGRIKGVDSSYSFRLVVH